MYMAVAICRDAAVGLQHVIIAIFLGRKKIIKSI